MNPKRVHVHRPHRDFTGFRVEGSGYWVKRVPFRIFWKVPLRVPIQVIRGSYKGCYGFHLGFFKGSFKGSYRGYCGFCVGLRA